MTRATSISGAVQTIARFLREITGNVDVSKTRQRKLAEHERRMALRQEVTIAESSVMWRRKRYERWARNVGKPLGRRMPGHIREKGVM